MFLVLFLELETSYSKFATNQTPKLDRNQGFLLQKLDAKISASYWLTKCWFNDALMIDLQILKFFKDIGRERPIFTVDVTKGLILRKITKVEKPR